MNRWPLLAEIRSLGVLGVPIIITQLAQMGMGVADAIMAGRVSATDLAGIALGGNLYWPLMLLMSGIVMAVTPSVSQLHGAGRIADAGAVVRQALWIAVCGGAMVAVLLQYVEPAYRLLGVDERAIPIATGYLRAASLGLPAMLVLRRPALPVRGHVLDATGDVHRALHAGHQGGAQLALHPWPAGARHPRHGRRRLRLVHGYRDGLFADRHDRRRVGVKGAGVGRFLRVFPAGTGPDRTSPAAGSPDRPGAVRGGCVLLRGQRCLIGRIGVDTVAAHQIAFNIVGVSFMVPLALGMAATIRVGFNVGADDFAGASRSAWVATSAAVVWGVVFAVTLLIWRHDLVGLYTKETDVVQLAAGLLLLGALFQVFDGPQATLMGTLRGYKDTRAPMMIALVAYWLFGLPVGAVLCFGLWSIPGIGVHGMWWGLVVGLVVVATALFARLARVSGDPVRVAQLRLR